jgi:hypothetical protein
MIESIQVDIFEKNIHLIYMNKTFLLLKHQKNKQTNKKPNHKKPQTNSKIQNKARNAIYVGL